MRPLPMRLLHTMLRVGNLERSLAFYTEVLGMQLLRRRDNPQYRYTVVFVGYGPESDTAVLELTHNWDTEHYEIGGGYGHIGIGCDDIALTCASIRERGGRVVRDPAPVKGGTSVIAFVEDPDGYRIELIERPPGAASASVPAGAAVAATSPAVPAVGACEPAAAAAVPAPRC